MGKGLLAPISMFNWMYRSIFTSTEHKLNRGWLRAKVLGEERARPGWLHQRNRGEQVGPGEHRVLCVCCAKKPEEVGWRGGAACSLGNRGSGELPP